jgi:hypothetical protein
MSCDPATASAARRHPWKGSLAVVTAVLLLACTASPTPSPIASASHTPGPTATASATTAATLTATASAIASAEPTDALGPFVCSLPITMPAVGAGQGATTDVRVGLHPGYDRLVFEYAGDRRPQLTVDAVTPPFSLDPSGLPLTVLGAQFVRIRLDGIVVGYTGATSLKPGGPAITDVERQGEYEGQQSWIVGLATGVCPRVLGLTGPSRWVVDFGRP